MKTGELSAPDDDARFVPVAVAAASNVADAPESDRGAGSRIEVVLRNGRVLRLSDLRLLGVWQNWPMRWKDARNDPGAGRNADLGSLRSHGYAQGLRWLGHACAGSTEEEPYSRHLFVFRGKRADRIKVLWWDGTGLCLYAKQLARADGLSGR